LAPRAPGAPAPLPTLAQGIRRRVRVTHAGMASLRFQRGRRCSGSSRPVLPFFCPSATYPSVPRSGPRACAGAGRLAGSARRLARAPVAASGWVPAGGVSASRRGGGGGRWAGRTGIARLFPSFGVVSHGALPCLSRSVVLGFNVVPTVTRPSRGLADSDRSRQGPGPVDRRSTVTSKRGSDVGSVQLEVVAPLRLGSRHPSALPALLFPWHQGSRQPGVTVRGGGRAESGRYVLSSFRVKLFRVPSRPGPGN
jgi:hypothetical protein